MSWIEWQGSRPRRPAANRVERSLAGGGAELLCRVTYLHPPEATTASASPLPAGPANTTSGQAAGVGHEWDGWPIAAERFIEATDHARRYRGPHTDTDAAEQAWSRRVDAAVQGMDGIDPAGLNTWMQTHATSPAPHLHEARLVAAWETHQQNASETADTDAWD